MELKKNHRGHGGRRDQHSCLFISIRGRIGVVEREKIIFFRDFFFAAFIIGLIFALLYFVATFLFWNTGASWATHFFKIDEKEFGRLVLLFFIQLRLVLVFFFLVPALALHWIARKR